MSKLNSSTGSDQDDLLIDSKKHGNLELIADHSKQPRTLLSYIGVYLWLGWFNMYLWFLISLPFLYYWKLTHTYAFAFLVGILIISAVAPIERSLQPQWIYNTFGKFIIHSAANYFQLKIFCEDFKAVLDVKPAILAMEPHDILPVSIFAYSKHLNHFSTHTMLGCLSSVCFMIPGMRHVYTWGDAISVERKLMLRYLKEGYSTGLCPGGVQEVTYMKTPDTKECVLFVRNRFGLIRLASETGAPIIPSFTFNQRPCYTWIIPNNFFTRWIGRRIGFLPLIYFGLHGSVFGQPNPSPLTLVVGKPIAVPKLDVDPSTGRIPDGKLQPYMDELVQSYERIFEENKARFSMGDTELKIV